MRPSRQLVDEILTRFPGRWDQIQSVPLGNHGGYSGAQLWKISTRDRGSFCLRQWPRHTTAVERIRWIHNVLISVSHQDFPPEKLPLPVRNHLGDTMLVHNGEPFELTRWLEGQADFSANPGPERIQAASRILAEFHLAAQTLGQERVPGGELKGLRQRQSLIAELKNGLLGKIMARLGGTPFAEVGNFLARAYQTLEPPTTVRLQELTRRNFFRQICIRDIWHDHLLFQQNQVSGIVDFGAMDFDHVATDIARLFGSLFQNCREFWGAGLAAYQSVNELSDLELELIEVYDRSSTMLAGMNWLKWILIENRKFENILPIIKRMELLARRVQDWI